MLLPEDDAYTEFDTAKVSLSAEMPKYITPELTQQILGAGHNFDYVDAASIEKLGIPYPVLVMPHVERLSPEVLKAIAAYVERGGKVIAVGSIPDRAPGFEDAARVSDAVKSASKKLFDGVGARMVTGDEEVGAALRGVLKPDFSSSAADLGFIHRKLEDGDVYFLANTGNQGIATAVSFSALRKYVSVWDPQAGVAQAMPAAPANVPAVTSSPLRKRRLPQGNDLRARRIVIHRVPGSDDPLQGLAIERIGREPSSQLVLILGLHAIHEAHGPFGRAFVACIGLRQRRRLWEHHSSSRRCRR